MRSGTSRRVRTDSRQAYNEADDPKRLIRVEGELQDIVGLGLAGRTEDALGRSRSLVAQHPDMRVALLQLAHLERESGNLPVGYRNACVMP